MSVVAHGTFRGKAALLKKDAETAFGILHFTKGAPGIIADVAHPLMSKFTLFFDHADPTQLAPWDGPTLYEFYGVCKSAADRIAAERARLLERPADETTGADKFLCVCKGGKHRSRMAALLIALLLGDPPPDDLQEQDMSDMAIDLYRNPPTKDDLRRLPPVERRKRSRE